MLCLTVCGLRSQTNKDLNTPARVKALYEINEQRKAYKNQIKQCEKGMAQLTDLAVSLGEESSKFVDHNMDLQAGLLSSIEKINKQEQEIIKLKARRIKPIGLGLQVGYGLVGPYFGVGVSYNIIRF